MISRPAANSKLIAAVHNLDEWQTLALREKEKRRAAAEAAARKAGSGPGTPRSVAEQGQAVAQGGAADRRAVNDGRAESHASAAVQINAAGGKAGERSHSDDGEHRAVEASAAQAHMTEAVGNGGAQGHAGKDADAPMQNNSTAERVMAGAGMVMEGHGPAQVKTNGLGLPTHVSAAGLSKATAPGATYGAHATYKQVPASIEKADVPRFVL